MKQVLVQQECGLGDILFCQGTSNVFKKQGCDVIWPIVPQLLESGLVKSEFNFNEVMCHYLWSATKTLIQK